MALADTFRWIGYGTTASPIYAVDWSDATKWTNLTAKVGNQCPGADDAVEFASYPSASVEYDVTPPASFCGTITGVKSDENYSRWFYPRIVLTDSADAQYTITGKGTFVASEHLGARIGAGFIGVLEIPHGAEFTVPAAVSNVVEIVGTGTAKLTAAAQIEQVMGMAGTIDLSGVSDLTVGDLAFLEGHDVILPGSMTLDTRRMAGRTASLPDWNTPDAWEFGGVQDGVEDTANNYTPYRHGPAVQQDGTLLLTDDYSQRNVAWLKSRTFGCKDMWQIKFSYQGSHPADGHPFDLPNGIWKRTQYGQCFGAVIAPGASGIPVATEAERLPADTYGIRFYNYGSSPNVAIVVSGNGINATDPYASVIRDGRAGVSQRTGKIDVTITMRKGRMFVTYAQGEASRSFVVNCSGIFSGDVSRRYSLGFFANTAALTWQHTEVSNFRGWCLTQDDGQWMEVPACRITASNWELNAYTNTVAAETKVDPADLVLENGDYKLLEGQGNWLGSSTCQTSLNPAKKIRVDYDIKWGAKTPYIAEGICVGFVNTATVPANYMGAFSISATYNPVSWSYYYYQDRMGFSAGGRTIGASEFKYGCTAGSRMAAQDRTVKCSLFSDGVNTLIGTLVNSEDFSHRVDMIAQCEFDFATRFANGMYPHCCGSTAGSSSIRTDISNFRAYEWNDATPAPQWVGGIKVPAGETCALTTGDVGLPVVTLGAGASLSLSAAESTAGVEVGSITADAGASLGVDGGVSATVGGIVLTGSDPHGVSVNGSLSFASGAKITLPAAWKSAETPISVVSVTSGTLPSGVAVELDDGTSVDARRLFLTDGGKTLNVNFRTGLRILFR